MAQRSKGRRPSRPAASEHAKSPDFDDIIAVKLVKLAEAVSRSASQTYEKLYGLKNTELRILGHLSGDGPLAIREISRRSKIDKAWISRSVDGLARRGLVEKTPHPTDSRITLLSLTKRGKELADAVSRLAKKRQDELLAGLSEDEVHRILNVLYERVQQMLEASDDQ